jgi:LacI family transcriptional regulator
MRNRLQASPPTIRDIARAAGVSVATVSRVLNGRGDVAPATRERVLGVIREQGFTTNPTARALSRGHSGLVTLTLPNIQAAYFSRLAAGVAAALERHDLRAVLCPTLHEHDRELGLLERLMRGATEGAVLILPSESADELEGIAARGYPLVVLDPKLPTGPDTPSVSAANTAGAVMATQHLLELGHRRIAAITGPRGWCATEERLAGFRAGLAAAGLRADERLEVEADFEIAGGVAAATTLLDLPEPPTAIFAFNDNLAVGVIEAARGRGLRLPGDLSVVGFDDVEAAPIVTPALTTVRQPLGEMGRLAGDVLVRLLRERRVEGMQFELATKLVVRESTAPPARQAASGQAGSLASGSPVSA